MLRYSSRPEAPVTNSTDDARNVFLLRSDLHHLFDQGRFILLPKKGVWVIHVLFGLPKGELATLYHNVTVQPLSELSIEFLLTHFAWAVLSQSIFLRADTDRQLVVVEGDEVRIENVSGLDCRTKFAPPGAKSRSRSPKKRARDAGSENQDDSDDLDANADDEDEEDQDRGRKRWRQSSSLCWPNVSSGDDEGPLQPQHHRLVAV